MTDLVDGPAGCGTQYTRKKKNKKHYYNYIQNYVLKLVLALKTVKEKWLLLEN